MSKLEVTTVAPQCGTTLTLGESGDTVVLGTGASQTGFGRTGTVDWQTTIKTSNFTPTNGEGYFVDTSSGAITVSLPAGVVGAIVAFKDYAQSFDDNNLTISANGSEKIEGLTTDFVLSTEGVAVTLVYGDATKGWQAVNSNDLANTLKFVTATGGTETIVCTNFKVHTFTGPGTFNVSCAGSALGSNSVDYLVVAGGGSGGNAKDGLNGAAGGAGAGGYRESCGGASGCYTASPLKKACGAITVSAQNYPITVGAGGANRSTDGIGSAGNPSTFDSITSAGGGAGGRGSAAPLLAGGSGGGSSCCGGAGAGNTPPVTPPQGNPGGNVYNPGVPTMVSAGGGGATASGGNGASGGPAGPGGAGATSSINGTPTARAGGGGGGGNNGETGGGSGGSGGGGAGGNFPLNPGTAGTVNTGGGGGASASGPGSATSGAGGSGIVIIRYKFQ